LGQLNDAPSLWRKAYDAADAGSSGLRMFTVSPGYDDRHLLSPEREGNPLRHVERQNGETYQLMQRCLFDLEQRPDIVMVSTFNEYHENSHIEASLDNGKRYLDMTRAMVRQARGTWK
jgi:hypothetical protein